MANRLESIRIASPCSAGWDQMQGSDRVRFCDLCQKNVFNISAMTTRQAEALIAKTDGPICMRLYRRADGTVLTEDCPVGIAAFRKRVLRIATAALSSALNFASTAAAQVQPNLQPNSAVDANQQVTGELVGSVLVVSGEPLANAIVSCRYLVSGKIFATHSDEKGQFQIPALPIGRYEIRVELPGFGGFAQTVVISQLRPARLDVKLPLGLIGEVMPVKPHNRRNPFAKLHL